MKYLITGFIDLMELCLIPEKDILEVLSHSESPMTAIQISKKIKTASHPTVFKLLGHLEELKLVKRRELRYKRKWTVWYMPSYVKRRLQMTKDFLKKK